MLALASGLSDHDLLARIAALAGKEREASVELVAHLAALDARPSLYAAQGYGSLFSYCTRGASALRRRRVQPHRRGSGLPAFPGDPRPSGLGRAVADLGPDAAIRTSRRRTTRPSWREACGRSRREIEALIAELAPRPDVPSSVRKLPAPTPAHRHSARPRRPRRRPATAEADVVAVSRRSASARRCLAARRPIIETTSPERYRVQFTIGKDSHDKLRRFRPFSAARSRTAIRARSSSARSRCSSRRSRRRSSGRRRSPRPPRPIRPGTDRPGPDASRTTSRARPSARPGGATAGSAPSSARTVSRCTERAFLEFHHIEAHALGGPPRPTTSRCAAAATINTRPSWSSGRARPPSGNGRLLAVRKASLSRDGYERQTLGIRGEGHRDPS